MSINRAVLVGNMTRDPELKSTASGTSVLSMRLAFSERRPNPQSGDWEDMPNYIDITLFDSRGKRADALSRLIRKGTRIGVDGRLRWSEWETSAGEKRSKIEVIADEIMLLDSREGGKGSGPSGGGGPAPSSGDDLEGEEIPF